MERDRFDRGDGIVKRSSFRDSGGGGDSGGGSYVDSNSGGIVEEVEEK
ncbi:MAG: hypothetical protein HYT97_06605 [Elusimicrobia bacterium]|nr:hypothetical protein [Elusimicrobiota bacterium]